MIVTIITRSVMANGEVYKSGDMLATPRYTEEFLRHLVSISAAAEYETKVDQGYEPVKKPLSSQSLPPVKASPKRTRKPRTKKPQP